MGAGVDYAHSGHTNAGTRKMKMSVLDNRREQVAYLPRFFISHNIPKTLPATSPAPILSFFSTPLPEAHAPIPLPR